MQGCDLPQDSPTANKIKAIVIDFEETIKILEQERKQAGLIRRWQINRQIASLVRKIEEHREFLDEIFD